MNKILYLYRIFAKLFAFLIFGIGTILIFVTVFPFLFIFSRSKLKFQLRARKVLHSGSVFVMKVLEIIGLLKIEISKEDKKKLHDVKSAIIIANHPAFFDSFLLISLLPCTDFIAKSALSSKNFLSIVVNTLFMTNDMPFDEMLVRSKNNFDKGGTLALFPEGTRSLPTGQNRFKKGAARISLATNRPIIPVYIGGNEKIGMRKGDKVLQVNPNEPYIYKLSVKQPIFPNEFLNLPDAIAAKRFTTKLKTVLSDENNLWF